MNHVRASRRQSSHFLQLAANARVAGRIAVGALFAAPWMALPTAAYAQGAQARSFDIPAGTLEDVLGQYGREAGIILSFKPDVTAGLDRVFDLGVTALTGTVSARATPPRDRA